MPGPIGAKLLEVGGAVTGQIDGSDADWFRVYLEAGQIYRLKMSGTEGADDPITVPNLSFLTSETDIRDNGFSNVGIYSQGVRFIAPGESGWHHVRLGSTSFAQSGAYTLTAEIITDDAGETRDTAQVLALNDILFAHTHSKTDVDLYEVTLEAGAQYWIAYEVETEGENPSEFPTLHGLYTEDGQLITDQRSRLDDFSESSSSYFIAPITGTYHLAVSGGRYDYTIGLMERQRDVGDTIATAAELEGTLSSKGSVTFDDVDVYKLSLDAGELFSLRGSFENANVELLNSQGEGIDWDYRGGLNWNFGQIYGQNSTDYLAVAETAGDYYLRLSETDPSKLAADGEYYFEYTVSDPGPGATLDAPLALVVDGILDVVKPVTQDVVFAEFVAEEDGLYRLRLTGAHAHTYSWQNWIDGEIHSNGVTQYPVFQELTAGQTLKIAYSVRYPTEEFGIHLDKLVEEQDVLPDEGTSPVLSLDATVTFTDLNVYNGSSSDENFLEVYLEGGVTYELSTAALGGSKSLTLYAADDHEQVSWSGGYNGWTRPAEDPVYLSVRDSGQYLVKIETSGVSDVTLSLSEVPDDLPAFPHDGQALVLDSPETHSFLDRFDKDFVPLDLKAGVTYRLTVTSLDKPVALHGIVDALGTYLLAHVPEELYYSSDRDVFGVLEDGRYYADLTRGWWDETEEYSVTLTELDDDWGQWGINPGTLDAEGKATGTINFFGDRDWFSFEAEAGKRYALYLGNSDADADAAGGAYLGGVYEADAEGALTHAPAERVDFSLYSDQKAGYQALESGTVYVSARGGLAETEDTFQPHDYEIQVIEVQSSGDLPPFYAEEIYQGQTHSDTYGTLFGIINFMTQSEEGVLYRLEISAEDVADLPVEATVFEYPELGAWPERWTATNTNGTDGKMLVWYRGTGDPIYFGFGLEKPEGVADDTEFALDITALPAEADDTRDGAQVLTGGTTLQTTFRHPDDVDHYTLHLEAGSRYRLSVNVEDGLGELLFFEGPGWNTVLEDLVTSDDPLEETWLIEPTSDTEITFDLRLDVPEKQGAAAVPVEGRAYTVSVETLDREGNTGLDTAAHLTTDGLSMQAQGANDADYITMDLVAGHRYGLTFTPTDGTPSWIDFGTAMLYSPDGGMIYHADFAPLWIPDDPGGEWILPGLWSGPFSGGNHTSANFLAPVTGRYSAIVGPLHSFDPDHGIPRIDLTFDIGFTDFGPQWMPDPNDPGFAPGQEASFADLFSAEKLATWGNSAYRLRLIEQDDGPSYVDLAVFAEGDSLDDVRDGMTHVAKGDGVVWVEEADTPAITHFAIRHALGQGDLSARLVLEELEAEWAGDGGEYLSPHGTDSVVFFGGAGNDTLEGSAAADTLEGGAGADSIEAGAGDDVIIAGAAADTVRGGDGDDWMDGLNGNDSLFGSTGDDYLVGWGGRDRLRGNDGNDTMVGGNKNDFLQGGSGADVFVFNIDNGFWAKDYIKDFELGLDRVVIEGFDAADVTWKELKSGLGVMAIVKGGGKIVFNGHDKADLDDFADWDFIA